MIDSLLVDDIQDYYLTEPAKAIMDTFKLYNFSLTLGIVGNHFGSDASIFDYVYNNLVYNPEWELEVASHGFNHEDFSTLTYSQQYIAMNASLAAIRSKLPIGPIRSFAPPYNNLNYDTISIAQSLGITHISAQVGTDYVTPYPMSGTFIYMVLLVTPRTIFI